MGNRQAADGDAAVFSGPAWLLPLHPQHPHLDGKPPAACGHPDTGLAGNADCASQAAAAQCQTPASPMHQALRDPDPAPSSTQSAQPPCAPGAAGGSAGACCCGDGEDASDSADNPIVLGTSLFFARVPPTVSYESIMELFAQFGTVLTLNLFRPWATAKTSKVRAGFLSPVVQHEVVRFCKS